MVRKGGFEPPRLSAPPPQDGVSASSTTSADVLTIKPNHYYSRSLPAQFEGQFQVSSFLPLHDCGKGLGVEASPSDQSPIDFFLRHQGFGVLWFNASPV